MPNRDAILAFGTPSAPLLLAVSDNGSQMIATGTRRFMALVAIAQHFGRP
ncbi:hypothetical protein SAMN06266982_12340, partial [Propioniciclava tarda]